MTRAKITKKSVDALKAGETLFDTEMRGFMVRARGASKNFAVKYSVDGRQRIFTIGRHGDLTASQARSAAQDALNRANQARHNSEVADPQTERQAKRGQPKHFVAAVCADFIERHAKKNRRWQETERILKRHVVPTWGSRPIASVKRSEIVALLDSIEDESGAPMATAVLAQMRKMFNWHATRDEKFNSPIVKGMARVRPKDQKRRRILNDDEIRVVWRALEESPAPYRQLVRALLLTAQRRDEVASLRPQQIDDGEKLFVIPPEQYKTGIAHAVPLSDFAVEVIRELPQDRGYLFTTHGDTPFSGFSKAKRALDEAVERLLANREREDSSKPTVPRMPHWVLHDLRRTAKTLMVRAGVRPDISERVLGHVIPGVEGTYDRHEYLNERRHALNTLAEEVRNIVNQPRGAVVRLSHAA